MRPGTIVLLHSPLTSAHAWGELPELLRARGHAVQVPEVLDDSTPPYAQRYVARVAMDLAELPTPPTEPLLLVGHSGAGELLPQIGYARRGAHKPVGGYLFLDATVPRPAGPAGPASRLDLMAAFDSEAHETIDRYLATGAAYPDWADEDLRELIPAADDRATLLAGLRPRGRDFFVEPLPFPPDWPDAPCGYLCTSPGYTGQAKLAAARGWPVTEVDLGHFAALRAPETVADALLELVARL
jgi:hypothetical protein